MSVPSLTISPDNTVNEQHLDTVLAKLGQTLRTNEKAEYLVLLKAFHDVTASVAKLPDYEPPTNLERFPRKDIHFPRPENNKLGAWAWRFTAKDTLSNKGILSGKTVVMKDNISVAGVNCLLGTEAMSGFVPTADATVVTRTLEAGGTILGKAVCENLSMAGTSFTAATGPVHNPHAKGYSAGGSSSGCGSLIASYAVDMGIGGDQGGSIRLPASWCGIYGLKPTQGLIPYTGIASLETTMDHTGPMSRTCLDNALLLKVLAGKDNIDDRCIATPTPSEIPDYPAILNQVKGIAKPLEGFKIGLLTEGFSKIPCEQGGMNDFRVSQKVKDAANKWKNMGAIVEDVSVPMHAYSMDLWLMVVRMGCVPGLMGGVVGRQGFYQNQLTTKMSALRTPEGWDKLPFTAKNAVLNGVYMQEYCPELYGKAINLIRLLREKYDKALDEFDVLVMPTTPYLATSHAALDATILAKITKGLGQTMNTCSFDVTGHPALSMPIGMLPSLDDASISLPVGLQIVSKHFHESKIYKAAFAWEDKHPNWKDC
ncbi:amidase signature enzyme [Lentinula aciculospora]|uniref:Amidase signature enzyme n=1 Tax=Lentinula aciculospora TaxID=153920 RepID=A0A9W9AFV3_9AGAR|nr:amidase signature enzyme [Lentinula aciculospora]